jgi:hypothetical protein
MISLLIPLLSLWLSFALALIDGFALPLARMKAGHEAADCIQQQSLAVDQAINEHSEQAGACGKALAINTSLWFGSQATASAREPAQAYSIEKPHHTSCALEVAICVRPEQQGEVIAVSNLRSIRYENNRCELEGQRAMIAEFQEPSGLSAKPDSGNSPMPRLGLAPLIGCDQQGAIELATADWHCVEEQDRQLRWWGPASKLESPCLVSTRQGAQAFEAATPAIGRKLYLRQSLN